MMANMATNYLATDNPPQRWGNAHPNIVPYQVFKVADGWVIVACGNDGQFRKLVEVGGEPALADDERFAINPQRVRNRQVLIPLLEPMMLRKTRARWIAALESAGVPCGPINDLADVFKDPHVLAREMRLDLPHPTAGNVSVPASALKMSGSPVEYRMPPPLMGEHTDSVLGQLAGLSTSELKELRRRAVI